MTLGGQNEEYATQFIRFATGATGSSDSDLLKRYKVEVPVHLHRFPVRIPPFHLSGKSSLKHFYIEFFYRRLNSVSQPF